MATPPFNPNVPLATSSPSQDQPVLLANSQTWFQTWNADGVTAGSSTNAGFSNQRTFVRRTSAPTANAANGQLFSMEDADGIAQLFWLAATQDGGSISQLTANAPGEVPSGSSGYFSYPISITSASYTVEQVYWATSGGLQIKAMRITQKTTRSSSTTQNMKFIYAGTGGGGVPFNSQPIYAIQYAIRPQSSSLSSVQGLSTFTSTSVGNTQIGAYLEAVILPINIASSSSGGGLPVTYALIIGS